MFFALVSSETEYQSEAGKMKNGKDHAPMQSSPYVVMFMLLYKQLPPFGTKISSDICPRTLSVPKSKQFSEREAQGKLDYKLLLCHYLKMFMLPQTKRNDVLHMTLLCRVFILLQIL